MGALTEFERYRRGYPEIMQAARDVLEFVFEHASPVAFPRMLYWMQKEHNRGSIDLYQNCLIVSLSGSEFFESAEDIRGPTIPMHSVRVYRCLRTAQIWIRTSYEFRMLAFQERLWPRDAPFAGMKTIGAALPDHKPHSKDFYATVGQEPPRAGQLSLQEWKEFLMETQG